MCSIMIVYMRCDNVGHTHQTAIMKWGSQMSMSVGETMKIDRGFYVSTTGSGAYGHFFQPLGLQPVEEHFGER